MELSEPSVEKYASLAAFWSVGLPLFEFGLTGLKEESDGEVESARRTVLAPVRAVVRDFRNPWAEDGRLPAVLPPLRLGVKSAGGADGVHGLS